MRKSLITLVTACLMAGTMSMTAFAGQWQAMGSSWAYQNDNGSYLSSGWNWVEGKCYYFDANGFILQNTTTPDGLTVDADGAWVVNGVVQTQEAQNTGAVASTNTVQINGMTFAVPEGFTTFASEEDSYYFSNASMDTVIAFLCQKIPGVEGYGDLLNSYQGMLLDSAMQAVAGTPQSQGMVQLASGSWYCYQYSDATSLGIPGALTAYARINGENIQLFLFAGAIGSLDTNAIMSNNVK